MKEIVKKDIIGTDEYDLLFYWVEYKGDTLEVIDYDWWGLQNVKLRLINYYKSDKHPVHTTIFTDDFVRELISEKQEQIDLDKLYN